MRHIRDAGLRVSGLCRGGLFTADLAAGIEDTKRAIDEAHALGADCLVMLAGGLPPGSRDLNAARFTAMEGLAAVQPHARAGRREARARAAAPDDLRGPLRAHARSARRSTGPTCSAAMSASRSMSTTSGGTPTLAEQIARAGSRIHGFHVCDLLVPTRDTVFDRGMMGDGAIDIPAIRALVEAQGYDGLIEVEIFSHDWWARDPDEVLRTVKQRFASAA